MSPTSLQGSVDLLEETDDEENLKEGNKEERETDLLRLEDNCDADSPKQPEATSKKQVIEDSPSSSKPPSTKKLREKKFHCQYPNCSATFSRPDRLQTHIDGNHVHILRYQCPTCHQSFASQDYLNKHISRVHLKKRTKLDSTSEEEIDLSKNSLPTDELGAIRRGSACTACCRVFRRKYQLRLHRAEYHNEPLPHQCPHCPTAFPLLYKLRRHVKSVHQPRNYQCALLPDCPFSTDKFSLLRKHHAAGHPEIRLRCAACGKTYRRADSLRVHEETAHGEMVPVFRCNRPGCGKTYSRESCLRTHLRNSHDAPRFGPCERCGSRFRHSKSYRQHVGRCATKVPGAEEKNSETKKSSEKEIPKITKQKKSVPKTKKEKNPLDEERRKAAAAYRRRLQRLPPVVYEKEDEVEKEEENDKVNLEVVDLGHQSQLPTAESTGDNDFTA